MSHFFRCFEFVFIFCSYHAVADFLSSIAEPVGRHSARTPSDDVLRPARTQQQEEHVCIRLRCGVLASAGDQPVNGCRCIIHSWAGWRGACAAERKRISLAVVLPLRFLPFQQMQLQASAAVAALVVQIHCLMPSCSVKKGKEGTGRAVTWRQIRAVNAFTMEVSFSGASIGSRAG